MEGTISVMAIPADEQRRANPYNYILNASLKAQGVTVMGYTLKRLLRANFDLMHLHKPERFLTGRTLFGLCKNFICFWLKIIWLKFRGKKLVWTVQNPFPFKGSHPALTKHFYSLLLRYTDGFITPTKHGARELVKFGVPATKIVDIPHPHCGDHYPNSIGKQEARKKLGIPSDKFVFLFAGHIRSYKNLAGLVKAFRQMDDKDSLLVIAGKIHFDVSNELEEWMQPDANILIFPQFIEDEDLQFFFNSADLVVMPDHNTHGFGTALLNLSFGKPILVPKTENFLALQRQVGGVWVKTFSGHLTAGHLKKSKTGLERQEARESPDLSFFDRSRVAKATRAFYEAVAAGKQSLETGVGVKKGRPVSLSLPKNKTVNSLQANAVSNQPV